MDVKTHWIQISLTCFILFILNKDENGDDYFIKVKSSKPLMACPNCDISVNVIRFGTREFFFMDTPGKRVGIAVDRQKFRCKNCSKVFYEQLPDMDDKRSATKRLVTYIEKQSLKRPHASIAEEVGFDEKTVRNIFRNYVNRLGENL